ncbi:MAG: Gldg family protein [bacterium]
MKGLKFLESIRLICPLLGAALAFLGERYFFGDSLHWWISGTGLSLVCLGIVVACLCLLNAKQQGFHRETPSWRLSIIWQSMVLLSFIVFLVYRNILGERPHPDTLMDKVLLGTWLVAGVLGLFMGFGVEWSKLKNGRGQFAEPQRVQLAAMSWLKIGMLAIVIACSNYFVVKRNVSWDLSYLKTSRPSPSTFQMISGLSQNVDVVLFFPAGNEVLSRARMYFDEIGKSGAKLTVSFYDMETSPVQAEEYKVSRNGFVVLRSSDLIERFDLGLTLDSARKGLKNLDVEFQRALTSVTQKKKVLYFTRGHGELGWVSDEKESEGLRSIKKLENYLRNSGYTLRFFGLSDGAANNVPPDADAVVIVGGSQPFLADEARVIQRYVESGGKLLVMLDVDVPTDTTLSPGVRDASKDPLVRWLKDSGAEFKAAVLANETNHVKATGSPVDKWFLYSNVFTSHASVQTLARNEQRAALIALKAGYFLTRGDHQGWAVFDTVRALSDTFVDENKDFRFNEKSETREPRVLGVALEQKIPKGSVKPVGRVVAFADATAASDALIENQANLLYIVDSLRWMFGEASVLGVPSSEEDIPIRHSKKEDIAWFYGTVALVPALILIVGKFATSRARRSRRRGGAEEQK